ncbi:MAG: LytR C-terminal domain-containing protein [Acidimicrobiales bacterium]|nr:LytR C-terminal domain-containing protein [Acidimicrobiales bacterium]HJM32316.1 LytR C-terminal domain-containing protein [Acidimicrobiales bacterium]
MAAGRGGAGLGPSNSATAPRALLLIVVAVLLGTALLWKGLDDGVSLSDDQPAPTTAEQAEDRNGDATGDGSGDATGDGSGDATGDGSGDATGDGSGDGVTETTSTLFPTVTEAPSDVQVLVANGSGTARAAAAVTQLLAPKGYSTLPPANAQPTDATMIYFRPGMGLEARAVMDLLAPDSPDLLAQIPPTGLATGLAENALDRLETADIVVILGADDRIHNG